MIHGVVNVRKEKGMTSFGVVARCRHLFGQKKIGHAGTLDPDAEGVLPVCLGRAARLVDFFSDRTKTYEAVLLLGVETDTQDAGGVILQECDVAVDPMEAAAAVLSFEGKSMQLPPMYSALKVNGQKLVDLARRGIEVERKPREIELSDMKILSVDLPRIRFSVTCSKGTYIRTLCSDIGKKLGCGGCMESLVRTRVGEFTIEEALTLSQIEERIRASVRSGASGYDFVRPTDTFFAALPAVTPEEEYRKLLINGNTFPISPDDEIEEGSIVRVYTQEGGFIGLYRKKGEYYRPEKIFLTLPEDLC